MPILPSQQPEWNPVDLAARLIRMGAIAPMPLDPVTHAQVELLAATLPSIYECRFNIRNQRGEISEVSKFDISISGLNRQVLDTLNKVGFQDTTHRSNLAESSPESWLGFLNRNVASVDLDEVLRSFSLWGISLTRERIQDAFCRDPIENLQQANLLLREKQIDLVARLVCMGVVPPFDFDHASYRELNEIVQKLPALAESQVVIRDDKGELKRLRFINLAEFHLKSVNTNNFYTSEYHVDHSPLLTDERTLHGNENQEIDDREEFVPPDRKSELYPKEERDDWTLPRHLVVGGAGQRTLQLQQSSYLFRHHLDTDAIIYQRQDITGSYAWSDYFKQDIQDVDPAGKTDKGHFSLKALKEAFKNWNLDFNAYNLESGFEKDVQKNFLAARFLFHKALLVKTFSAGIYSGMPLKEWKFITPEKAAEAIRKIPLLPEQDRPGEWLELFRNPVPSDPMELVRLQSSFLEAGIEYNEQAILASFKQPEQPKKEVWKMEELDLKDYKQMAARLSGMGKLDLPREEREQMSLEDLRDYVRMADDPASEKQQMLLATMMDEGRIAPPPDGTADMSKMEVSMLIDKAPKMDIPNTPPEHPVTEATQKELQSLQNNGIMPRIPWPVFRNMSEEDALQKIDSALARQPASERQKEFINDAMAKGTLTDAILGKYINAPVIGAAEIDKLNMFQARNIIGDMPASEKQIETVRQLAQDGRIPERENYENLTNREARKILDDTFSKQGAPDPEGPSTTKQRETIQKLIEDRQIEPLSQEEIKAMTFAEASKAISDAPATPAQKQMYARLVHDGKLDSLPGPTFDKLTRGVASNHIDVGTGKLSRDKMIQVEIIDYPASDAQLKVLEELRNKGKVGEIPPELTNKAASKMIADAIAGDPISPQQLAFLEKKIANNQIPPMSDEEKKALTQSKFNDLIKIRREPEKEPEKTKAPEVAAPSKLKNNRKQPVGMTR